jgi:predicted membrane protein
MFIGLFVILLVLWALGFGVMHTAGFLIHILLIAALISLVIHFVAPRSSV